MTTTAAPGPRWDTSLFERAFPRLPVMRRVETFDAFEVRPVVAVLPDGRKLARETYREYLLDPSEFAVVFADDPDDPEVVAWGLYGRADDGSLAHVLDCESREEAGRTRALFRDLRPDRGEGRGDAPGESRTARTHATE